MSELNHIGSGSASSTIRCSATLAAGGRALADVGADVSESTPI